ncbi:hypothetical protein EDB85DRAFT_1999938 [Lactarius pseudohatsudake]|nr:hypothetical protein EDB85DRAFT_1999938 [Lactarius pseudohatsudake]
MSCCRRSVAFFFLFVPDTLSNASCYSLLAIHRLYSPHIGLLPPPYYFTTHWMLFAIASTYIATVRHRAFTASDPYSLCVHDAPSSSSTRFVERPTPPVNPKRAPLSNTTASRSYGALNYAHTPSPTRVLVCKEPQESPLFFHIRSSCREFAALSSVPTDMTPKITT